MARRLPTDVAWTEIELEHEERWCSACGGRMHVKRHRRRVSMLDGPVCYVVPATMMLALDAHRHHPQPFTEKELQPYRDAEIPNSQKEVLHRRRVMRAARSSKKRAELLRKLEERYAASSPH